jgi:YidC/Oxa1 family membrane protein insertase
MENQRLFLFVGLSIVLLLLWQTWAEQHQPSKPVSAVSQTGTQDIKSDEVPDLPPAMSLDVQGDATALTSTESQLVSAAQKIHVLTDLLDVEINTAGGDLRKVYLVEYLISLDEPENKFQLFNDTLPQFYIAQSGLISREGNAPDHHAIFQSEQESYTLAPDLDELKVPLIWVSDDGVKVTKTLTFHRNSYVVDVDYSVENNTGKDWPFAMYRQLQRSEYGSVGESRFIYTFTGGVVSAQNKVYEKVEFADMMNWKPEESYYTGGWVGMLQHYFLSAWLTNKDDELNRFYTKVIDDSRYVVGMTTPEQVVADNSILTVSSRLFVGPKEQQRLEEAAPNLRLSVDYGILTVLAQPLFWLMTKIHSIVNNWGWSIIILTLMIKLAFYKLSEAQYRSMANMRRLQPKMAALKERFGDDRQKMSQAMMEMYKKEKVNPLAGCLPILLQIPVFISLYWVLVESVELRQADFALWINDLTAKDPYYILPLLMGASMFAMQKMNPAPPDPLQAKIMMSLPFVFTIFFAFFPAGLVLYWVSNNLLSMSQQWFIMKKLGVK